jgi:hypothetical protein
MPDTTTETYDWQDWVNEYIEESKSLITVHRKNVLLKHLQEFGVQKAERRNGVVIDLDGYELDMPPGTARERYARIHEELWIEFVRDSLTRAGMSYLIDENGMGKAEFARELRS